MVDDPNCRYCRLFDKEIGGLYPKTDEGRYAPLVRVRRKSPELKGLNPVIYTPTFVLVRNGEELGRIIGYPGPEFFFSELRVLLGRTGFTGRINSTGRDT
jgi:thioredoxin-related protein